LVGGLPGTGKSTLARGMAERAGFRAIRSDVVRKELAGTFNSEPRPAAFGEGIYTAEWTERTYAECLRRAEGLLFEGNRVLVDANFREDRHRRAFLKAAIRWGVPGAFLLCQVGPEVVRTRLANRRGEVSDADWSVYRRAAQAWEEPGPLTRSVLRTINTDGTREHVLDTTVAIIQHLGLCN
jgi:predicted kinase